VHERKQFEEALQEADRRKDEFLALLAHELRNPLAPIRSGLHVLELAKHDPDTIDEVRGMMERQLRQLVALVDDLMDVSRITRGKFELETCRLDVADVLRTAVEGARPALEEAGHELALDLPAEPVHIDADPTRLAQVVSNLLDNATKYTPEGGHVRLSAAREGDEVVIAVADDGVGVPAEMRERIFEMFAQIERPSDRRGGGLGLGLTLVKSVVEMHGGRVEVESEGEDRGSVFRVRLPLARSVPFPVPAAADVEGVAAPAPARRVLVVDDNEAAAELLGRAVRMLGNDVRTAADGEEALEVALEFRPHVVLMDLRMPRLDGFDAARRLRREPWAEKLVLVALSGYGQAADRRRTTEAGFDLHLVKPVAPAELARLLAGASE
jgi:CheY-like chemotaxis protein